MTDNTSPADVEEIIGLVRRAHDAFNVITVNRDKIGPLATQAQTAGHALALAESKLRALLSAAPTASVVVPGAEFDRLRRAVYEDQPFTVISEALANATGLPMGATIPFDTALATGMNAAGLQRIIRVILTALSATPAPASSDAVDMREACEDEQTFLDLLRREFDAAGVQLTQEVYAPASRAMRALAAALPPSTDREARLVEALEEAASAFDNLYHYTFDHGLSPSALVDIVRRDTGVASTSIRAALAGETRNG